MLLEAKVKSASSGEKQVYIFCLFIGAIFLSLGAFIGDGELSTEEFAYLFSGLGVSVVAAVVISWLSMNAAKNRNLEQIRTDELLQQCNQYGLEKIYSRRGDISSDELLTIVSNSARRIEILTVANQEWLKEHKIIETIKRKVENEFNYYFSAADDLD